MLFYLRTSYVCIKFACITETLKQNIMLDFTAQVQEVVAKYTQPKYKGKFSDFQIDFKEDRLFVSALITKMAWSSLDGKKVKKEVRRSVLTLGSFFIPTAKGFVSADWKKTEFYKGSTNVDQSFIDAIEPYLQSETPQVFVRKDSGITVAHAIMGQINDAGSMLEEYSK